MHMINPSVFHIVVTVVVVILSSSVDPPLLATSGEQRGWI